MQNEIFVFFSFCYLYSHLLVTLYSLTILLRDPEGSRIIKVIFLNWSTEESLFVTECNTMVEGVDHKKNKEKEDFMYSVTRN